LSEAKAILKKEASETGLMQFSTFYIHLVELLDHIAEQEFEDIVSSYNTPAERIVKMLQTFRSKYVVDDPEMDNEICYAIKQINDRQIYNSRSSLNMATSTAKQEVAGWIKEYSELGNEELNTLAITGTIGIESKRQSVKEPQGLGLMKKQTIRTLLKEYERFVPLLEDAETINFDIFKFEAQVGRSHTLPLMVVHFIVQNDLETLVNHAKFA
jgi:hypothetical protein